MMEPMPETSVHASMIVVGESGILIRGRSGTGKSRLAQALIAEGSARGVFARLVADDRVRLLVVAGRVVARAPKAIAGMIEERGTGLLEVEHETAVVVRCLVDLDPPDIPEARHARMPDAEETRDELDGVSIARIRLDRDISPGEGAMRVLRLVSRSR
jgi:HPr kinase/phosphorylase